MATPTVEPLIYEETPIIEPIVEKKLPDPLDAPELSSPKKRETRRLSSCLGSSLFFVILFVLGVVGSTFVRPYLEGIQFPAFPSAPDEKTPAMESPTPSVKPVDQTAEWKEYSLRVGTGVLTYTLPSAVVAPVCDGAACPSEGTYLPNGTRMTISLKTTQPITNFAQLIVKDAGGKVFETSETSVAGLTAVDFSGTFAGSTTGGYSFTKMHGVMIQITPTATVEINHFAPNGITVDFEKDDATFLQILKTVHVTSTPSATAK